MWKLSLVAEKTGWESGLRAMENCCISLSLINLLLSKYFYCKSFGILRRGQYNFFMFAEKLPGMRNVPKIMKNSAI